MGKLNASYNVVKTRTTLDFASTGREGNSPVLFQAGLGMKWQPEKQWCLYPGTWVSLLLGRMKDCISPFRHHTILPIKICAVPLSATNDTDIKLSIEEFSNLKNGVQYKIYRPNLTIAKPAPSSPN